MADHSACTELCPHDAPDERRCHCKCSTCSPDGVECRCDLCRLNRWDGHERTAARLARG